jgi:hypothetical protein
VEKGDTLAALPMPVLSAERQSVVAVEQQGAAVVQQQVVAGVQPAALALRDNSCRSEPQRDSQPHISDISSLTSLFLTLSKAMNWLL